MIPCKAQAAGVTVLVGTAVGIPLGLLLTLRIPLVPLLGVEPVRKFAAGEDDHNHNITSMTNNNKNSNVLKGFRAVPPKTANRFRPTPRLLSVLALLAFSLGGRVPWTAAWLNFSGAHKATAKELDGWEL